MSADDAEADQAGDPKAAIIIPREYSWRVQTTRRRSAGETGPHSNAILLRDSGAHKIGIANHLDILKYYSSRLQADVTCRLGGPHTRNETVSCQRRAFVGARLQFGIR
jgi:hypothetical protein